jgi:universal stress protein E
MAAWKFKSILVAIEFPLERRQPGLARAARLAQSLGARLMLVHCAFDPYVRPSRFDTVDYERQIEESLAGHRAGLERLARPLRRRGLRVGVQASWDYPPFEGIVREVLRSKPDLVVAETRERPRGARLFLSNNDWQLIRLCPAPLLLVKKGRARGKSRVLAAIDPLHAHGRSAHLDERILEVAQAVTSAHDGRLDVVHAYLPLTTMVAAGVAEAIVVPVDPQLERRHERDIRSAVHRVCAPLRLPPRQVHVEIGPPESVICRLAKRLRADVVVMGAISRRGLERIFVGNTAERILDPLPCDVLVVKPARFRTTVPRRTKPGRTLLSAI